ncbi:hypothetical protein SAMN05216198_0447 [Halopseudomonas litoralis]|uniref:Uncharacterized protein n=1 Tax=Halopseudomonas litoralis TaxID=797277 RepID=A0A1H1LZ74_9GAMM|nr:hypothetical protein [Halopseudomonas litoralis]SDR79846.1 hypothetical protein SAMN05216198_0447 [Halopseudomonas litoralis]
MRVDGFNPANALSTRPTRPAAPSAESTVTGAAQPAAAARTPPIVPRVVEQPSANFEYIPARQGPTEPVHGYANQALASYQSMANLPDADADGVFGIDLFV